MHVQSKLDKTRQVLVLLGKFNKILALQHSARTFFRDNTERPPPPPPLSSFLPFVYKRTPTCSVVAIFGSRSSRVYVVHVGTPFLSVRNDTSLCTVRHLAISRWGREGFWVRLRYSFDSVCSIRGRFVLRTYKKCLTFVVYFKLGEMNSMRCFEIHLYNAQKLPNISSCHMFESERLRKRDSSFKHLAFNNRALLFAGNTNSLRF